jgi:hypothetical protein
MRQKKDTDPWYQFSGAVEEFNVIQRKRVAGSFWISVDESMSAWKPRTTDKGGLSNISFILRKPKSLGTKFKSSACPITGVLRFLEIQRVRGDAWFGSVKTASELAIQGFECVLQVKQHHSLYPKEFIDEALKDAPGGIGIFLEGIAPNEVPLIAVRYQYS